MPNTIEFVNYLKFEKRYSHNTIVAYQSDLNNFERYLHNHYEVSIEQVGVEMIRSWMMFLISSSCSKPSLNRKLSSLRQFFRYLIKLEVIKVNPMIQIVSLKTDKKIPSFITIQEMNFLLDKVIYDDDYIGRRDKVIIEMFYNTGIRLSELIAIKVHDIDFSQSQLKVFGKRSKERIIPLLNSHLISLSEYLKFKKELFPNTNFLFTTNSGDVMYPKLVYRMINSYLQRVTTVNQKSPHVLRHAFASHMLNDGADLNAIKEILGHASLTSTQIYTHTSVEQLKVVYKQAHPRGDH
tara:strand:- start:409 stop:1293 length:885 start_codon:yes stop_codon:yes gene_type:complete